ncbi:uncharacterized protein ACA1_182060 [Acanthamoeba castellanii str. Neff]|uniref:Glycosyltransferase family 1 protein n=1 Tax=Acanthamoeba castellanii (strain ATCC 30010 / Neff) TaxID=1257118 RepID=L8H816_ACACF|nr:uncharacterized protein ACA1_182060 [Acanthamoeba castellanii str. Neff]ELR21305.1 hypothetical protein ACA1_182060 [Acanthamoeba castellanii str. Neff]
MCVSTARQFSVLRYENERVNQYFVEVQDWVVHGLRGHGVDVNTPKWPSCLDHPRNYPESCLGRTCVTTFACTNDMTAEAILRTVLAGHDTSVVHFQLEVVGGMPRPCFDDPSFLPLWRLAAVWDYSAANVAALAQTGPLSSLPGAWARPAVVNLTSYPGISGDPADDHRPPERKRFDEPYTYDVVLLMGMNPRRLAMVNALLQRNLTVFYPPYNSRAGWGRERVALVRSAALLLNVHQFDAASGPIEAPRLIFLLSLGVSVLSEDSTDQAGKAYWADGVEFVPYDQLADAAVRLVANATRRYELAAAGYRLVRRVSPRDAIKSALMAALDWTNTSYSLQACPS